MGNSIYLGGGIKSAFCGGNVKEIWQGTNKLFPNIIGNVPFIFDLSKFDLTTLKQGDVQFSNVSNGNLSISGNDLIATKSWPTLPLENFKPNKNLTIEIEFSISTTGRSMWYLGGIFGGVMGSANGMYSHPAFSVYCCTAYAKSINCDYGYFEWSGGWRGYGDLDIDPQQRQKVKICIEGKKSTTFVNGTKEIEIEYEENFLDLIEIKTEWSHKCIIMSSDYANTQINIHSLKIT